VVVAVVEVSTTLWPDHCFSHENYYEEQNLVVAVVVVVVVVVVERMECDSPIVVNGDEQVEEEVKVPVELIACTRAITMVLVLW